MRTLLLSLTVLTVGCGDNPLAPTPQQPSWYQSDSTAIVNPVPIARPVTPRPVLKPLSRTVVWGT